MRILLVGEFSRLHNTLKEGLKSFGHEVIIVSDGDGFKNFPTDYSIEPKWCNTFFINLIRQAIFKLTSFDIAKIERGIRFYILSSKFKKYDVVQIINELPIHTIPFLELFLLKKLKKENSKFFVLSSGVDFWNVSYCLKNKSFKSIFQPLFENNQLKKNYKFCFDYLKQSHSKINKFLSNHCNGIIATDFDYVIPIENHPKFIGLIPNPINISKLKIQEIEINDKIIIFLGINEWNYYQKGISYFEETLKIVKEMFGEKVEIIIAKNLPYNEYINLYNGAHILLDQVFANDQGYNALEAMAKGKVVFTGAEKNFIEYYEIDKNVCINAKPDVEYLVNQLSFLIENPHEILSIGKRAKKFIEDHHNYKKIANLYIATWENQGKRV